MPASKLGAAGRSSIEALGPSPPPRGRTHPRTPTEDRPCGRCRAPGRSRGTSFLFVVSYSVFGVRFPGPRAPDGARPAALNLPAQAELLDQRAVPGNVGPAQVVQQATAAADEQQQAATAVVVV